MPIDPTTLHGRPWKSLTVPARIPRPNERPPVYAIGRFVVITNSFGGRFVTDAAEWTPAKIKEWTDDGMDLDTLLHAIAKAEGR